MIQKIGNIFHLSGKNISYVMALAETNEPVQLYFGKKIRVNENYRPRFSLSKDVWDPTDNNQGTFGEHMREYPSYGYPDTHMPAYEAENPEGNSISYLQYKEHMKHRKA